MAGTVERGWFHRRRRHQICRTCCEVGVPTAHVRKRGFSQVQAPQLQWHPGCLTAESLPGCLSTGTTRMGGPGGPHLRGSGSRGGSPGLSMPLELQADLQGLPVSPGFCGHLHRSRPLSVCPLPGASCWWVSRGGARLPIRVCPAAATHPQRPC